MSHQDTKIAVKHLSNIFKKDWKRLGEGFSLRVHSPPSSPPEIRWSSSGSSDDDNTTTIRSCRTHHRIITRLNFDSCVVQSPISAKKFRAHVTRSVINVGRIDLSRNHPRTQCHFDECDGNENTINITDIKNPLCDDELTVINENIAGNNLENPLPKYEESQNSESLKASVKNSKDTIINENASKKNNLTSPIKNVIKEFENSNLLPDVPDINSVYSENPNTNPDSTDIYSASSKNTDLLLSSPYIKSASFKNTDFLPDAPDINSLKSLMDDSIVSSLTGNKSPSLLHGRRNLYRKKQPRRKKGKPIASGQQEGSLSPVMGSHRIRYTLNKSSMFNSEITLLESSKFKQDNSSEFILDSEREVIQTVLESPVRKINSSLCSLKSKAEVERKYDFNNSPVQTTQTSIFKFSSEEDEPVLGISEHRSDSYFCHVGLERGTEENTLGSPVLRSGKMHLGKEMKKHLGSPILNVTLHNITNTERNSMNACLQGSVNFQNNLKSFTIELPKEDCTDLKYRHCTATESSKSVNGLQHDTVETECDEDENVIVQELVSSPIFGNTEGKKTKWKRKKLVKKVNDFSSKENAMLDVNSRLIKVCKNLFSGEPIENMDQSTKVNLDEVCEEITTIEAEDSHEESVIDMFSQNNAVQVDHENNARMDADFRLTENEESIDEIEMSMGSIMDSNRDLLSDVLIVESQYKQVVYPCDVEEQESDVVTTQPQIETHSSLEIEKIHSQSLTSQENGSGRVSRVSSPTTSSGNYELNSISSCSTPEGQRIVRKSESEDKTGGTELYIDSAKKKRLRLNRSGLAARLKKLISRNESAKNMWRHEMNQPRPSSYVNKGIVLTILSVKKDCSRTLLYCSSSSAKFVSPHSSESDSISDDGRNNKIMGLMVLLETLPQFKLKSKSLIRIYPPWQVVNLPRLNSTIVLGVSCLEEVHDVEKYQQNLDMLFKPEQEVTETVYACPCSCLQDDTKKCQYQFKSGGLEFLEYLLPLNLLKKIPINDANKSNSMLIENSKNPVRGLGTLSEAVTNLGSLLTGDIWLHLYILQVFCYKSRNCIQNSNNQQGLCAGTVTWSVLGCDTAGECCELILGPSSAETSKSPSWIEITTRQAIGHLYKFTGFNLIKRIHKTKIASFWALINRASFVNELNAAQEQQTQGLAEQQDHLSILNSSILPNADGQSLNKIGACQLFMYVLAPGMESWEIEVMEQSRVQAISITLPDISYLADALQMSERASERHTNLVKLICTVEDHMYVSDLSLNQGITNGYMKIGIKNSCFVPNEVRCQKTTVVLLQDLVYDKGILNVDKYSWVIPIADKYNRDKRAWCPQLNNEDFDLLANIQVKPPDLMASSALKDLVIVTGTVSNVDEDTAFSWPVCAVCENELLVELSGGNYLCQECNSSQTCIKMSLEVYLECKQIPEFNEVKVKLQQTSIMKLLPVCQNNSEGYELSSVLGHDVGPLSCIVTRATANSFSLIEFLVM